MTCIVGLEFKDGVLIGGDLLGTDHNLKVLHTQPKVFNKRGVVFGYTTSYRFGQILEHSMPDPVVPAESSDIYRWLITTLVPSIKNALKDNEYSESGECLIGVRDQLWILKDDFAVLRPTCGFSSVGSGDEYALGSMFTSMTHTSPDSYLDAERVLRTAIITASTFCPSVGIDSQVISNGYIS